MEDIFQQQVIQQGNQNVGDSIGVNPDQQVNDVEKANALGIRVDEYKANRDSYDARASQAAMNLYAAGPVLQKFYANREKQLLIANDLPEFDRLDFTEKIFSTLKQGWNQFGVNTEMRDAIDASRRFQDPLGTFMSENQGEGELENAWAQIPDRIRNAFSDKLQLDSLKQLQKEAEDLAVANRFAQVVKPPKVLERWENAKGWDQASEAFWSDPLSMIGYVGGTSLAQQFVPMLMSMPAFAFSPLAGAVASGGGSAYTEYLSSFVEKMGESGVDLTDSNAIVQFLLDPTKFAEAQEFASQRAGGVGLWDAVGGLVAATPFRFVAGTRGFGRQVSRALRGRHTAPLQRTKIARAIDRIADNSPIMSKFDAILSQTTVGGFLGGVGEFTAQMASGQETDWGDIFLEAIGEFFTMPAEIASAQTGIAMAKAKEYRHVQVAKKASKLVTDLAKVASISNLRGRKPEVFKEVIKEMGENSQLKEVYVRGSDISNELGQSILELVPELGAALEEARGTGGDLVIPMDILLTSLSEDGKIINGLKDHIRISQDGMSVKEADEWVKQNRDFMNRHFDAVFNAQIQKEEYRKELKTAVDPMAAQLNVALRETMAKRYAETGLMSQADAIKRADEVTTHSMRLFGAQLARFSALAGMTPKQFMERYPNQIQAMVENLKAQSLNQPVTQGIRWSMGVKYTDPEMKVRVFDIEEKDALPYADLKSMLVEKMGDGIVNQDSGFRLTASGNDIDKWLQVQESPSPQKVYLVSQIRDDIEEIFAEMKLAESHADKKKIQKGMHVFVSALSFGGKLYRLQVAAKDFAGSEDGRVAAHAIGGSPVKAEIEELTIEEIEENPTAQGLIGVGGHVDRKALVENQQTLPESITTVRTTTLSNLMGGVNPFRRADGKGYFEPVDSKEFSKGGVYYSKEDALTQEAVAMMTSAQKVQEEIRATVEALTSNLEYRKILSRAGNVKWEEVDLEKLPEYARKSIVSSRKRAGKDVAVPATKEEVKAVLKREIKLLVAAASELGIVKTMHLNRNLTFKSMPVSEARSSDTKKQIHKSPSWNRRQSSVYYLDVIDGRLAYVRISNHWGKFSTNRKTTDEDVRATDPNYDWDRDPEERGDQFGRIGTRQYDWELDGGKVTKDGNYANVSQAGYIFLDDVATTLQNKESELNQTAWHGSPYVFDMFSLEHIGSGEGAQAHGWGLYFALNKQVAEGYRARLTKSALNYDGKEIYELSDEEALVIKELERQGIFYEKNKEAFIELVIKDRKKELSTLLGVAKTFDDLIAQIDATPRISIAAIEKLIPEQEKYRVGVWLSRAKAIAKQNGKRTTVADVKKQFVEQRDFWTNQAKPHQTFLESVQKIDASKIGVSKEKGRLFEVEIPDADVMLDEQKYFEDQSDYVQDRLKDAWAEIEYDYELEDLTGAEIYQAFVEHYGSPKEASLAMNEHGIEGITYDGRRDGPCAVVFDEKAIRILEFYQAQMNEKRRAAYNPSEGVTRLFKMADESSFIHESAHYWLNTLALICGDIVDIPADQRTAGEQELLEILDGFLKWAGLDAKQQQPKSKLAQKFFSDLGLAGDTPEARVRIWNSKTLDQQRQFHEQFARGYEAYLRNGKAPTSALGRAFAKFKEWLLEIYKDASELQVEMTPEVYALYDRLFMSEMETKAETEGRHIIPLFTSAKAAGMSDDEFSKLKQAYDAVTEAIGASIRAGRERNHKLLASRVEREKLGLEKEFNDMIAQARMELEKSAVYRAWSMLDEGTTIEGIDFHSKLSRAEVTKILKGDTALIDALEAKGFLTDEAANFVPAKILADFAGARSAKQLVTDLAEMQPIDEEATEIAETRFMQQYGNLPNDEGLTRSAVVAVAAHDPSYSKALAYEYNALAKLTGSAKLAREGASKFAREKIGQQQISQLRPIAHARAEARAGKDAERAFRSGDLVGAAIHKRNQVVQHHIAKAGYDALTEVQRGIKFVKKALKSKSIYGSYMVQIENLAARFGLANVEFNRGSKQLGEFLTEEEFPVGMMAEFLETDDTAMPYEQMTVEDFRELMDAIKMLVKTGREKNTVIIEGRRQSLKETVDSVKVSIEDNATKQKRDFETRYQKSKPGDLTKQSVLRFIHSHIKIASWARIMDGDKLGAMWNTFIRRANECGDRETELRHQLTKQLQEIFDPLLRQGGMHSEEVVLPTANRPLTRQERIAFALNWGNDGNRQRLKDGFGIGNQEADVILRSLSESEWRAVEQIWAVFEGLRPEMEALEVRLYGRPPRWIDYSPFDVVTSEGKTITVSGGYYPAVYDFDADERANKHEDMKQAESLMHKAARAVATDRSHMKKRAAHVERPISLLLSNCFDALNNEVHDLCWREYVIDAQRLLKGGVSEQIRGYYGADVARDFQKWLQDVALGEQRPREGCEAWLSTLRQGVGLAGLGFNVVSAISQFTGLISTTSRLGAYTGVGLGQYIRNPIEATRQVCEQSLFMKNRGLTRFRELNEVNNRIRNSENRIEQTMDWMRTGGYWMLLKIQQIVDTITWLGAYQRAIDNNHTVEEARAMADQEVIDTQGSGMIKDQASVERGGPAMKMLTVFYSFMNTAFNLNATAFLGDRNRYRATAKILTMTMVMPVVEGMLRGALPVDISDDDDDDDITADMLKQAAQVINFNAGMLLGVRELATLSNVVSGEPIWSYQGPGGFRLIGDIYKATQQVAQGEYDAALVKSLVNLGGSMFGLPSAQINRVVSSEAEDLEGADYARGVLFGVKTQ